MNENIQQTPPQTPPPVNPQQYYRSYEMGKVLARGFQGVFRKWKPILGGIVLSIALTFLLIFPFGYAFDVGNPSAFSAEAMSTGLIIFIMLLVLGLWMFIMVLTDITVFAFSQRQDTRFLGIIGRALKGTFPVLFVCLISFICSYFASFLLIIPGIIISAGWAVIGPAYLHEDISLFSVFGRSWELTSGYKWWVWLTQIVMSLIVFGLYFVFTMVTSLGFGSMASTTAGLAGTLLGGFFGILGILSFYSLFCLYASFTTSMYVELREIREGVLTESAGAVFD